MFSGGFPSRTLQRGAERLAPVSWQGAGGAFSWQDFQGEPFRDRFMPSVFRLRPLRGSRGEAPSGLLP